jgi:hypothetical protein
MERGGERSATALWIYQTRIEGKAPQRLLAGHFTEFQYADPSLSLTGRRFDRRRRVLINSSARDDGQDRGNQLESSRL